MIRIDWFGKIYTSLCCYVLQKNILEMKLFGFRNSVNLLGCASDIKHQGASDKKRLMKSNAYVQSTHMFSIKWFLHVSTKWLTSRPESNSGHHLLGHLSFSVPRQTANCSLCRMSLPWTIPKGSHSDPWTCRDQHLGTTGYEDMVKYIVIYVIKTYPVVPRHISDLWILEQLIYVLIMGVDVLPQKKWVLIMGVDDP